ncbi:MAG: hypothetical protein JJ863_31185 [Deltaproteobacteria bacterium]|nr:hypothetical protein [Deltaproteobacteria bacterium]
MVSEFGELLTWHPGSGWEADSMADVMDVVEVSPSGLVFLTGNRDLLLVDSSSGAEVRWEGPFVYEELVPSSSGGFCGRTVDGRVECSSGGVAGRAATPPEDVGLSGVKALLPGVCALTGADGRVVCWDRVGAEVGRDGHRSGPPKEVFATGASGFFQIARSGFCISNDAGELSCTESLRCTSIQALVGPVEWIPMAADPCL